MAKEKKEAVNLTLSPTAKKRLVALAAECGLSQSSYVEQLVRQNFAQRQASETLPQLSEQSNEAPADR